MYIRELLLFLYDFPRPGTLSVPVASAELMWGLGNGRLAYTVPWLAWLASVSTFTLAARRGEWAAEKGNGKIKSASHF